jgi:hypothetical protein
MGQCIDGVFVVEVELTIREVVEIISGTLAIK